MSPNAKVTMEKQSLDVYSSAINAAIVRAPGRRFPGVIVQGDTLYSLHELAVFIAEAVCDHPDEDVSGEAMALRDCLAGFLAHYEAVMDKHGEELPY